MPGDRRKGGALKIKTEHVPYDQFARAAALLGAKGGRVRGGKKAQAARENGKKNARSNTEREVRT